MLRIAVCKQFLQMPDILLGPVEPADQGGVGRRAIVHDLLPHVGIENDPYTCQCGSQVRNPSLRVRPLAGLELRDMAVERVEVDRAANAGMGPVVGSILQQPFKVPQRAVELDYIGDNCRTELLGADEVFRVRLLRGYPQSCFIFGDFFRGPRLSKFWLVAHIFFPPAAARASGLWSARSAL